MYKITDNDYKSIMVLGKYTLFYLPIEGRIINSNPKTIGLMLFKTKKKSQKFARSMCMPLLILGVKSEDKVIALQEKICMFSDEKNLTFFYSSKTDRTKICMDGPVGTVCCYSLRVLKEIEKINWRDV